jgi:hypothetical protein
VKRLISFDGTLERAIGADNSTFEVDPDARDLEKTGYDADIFRGNVYNDYFTPIYKIKDNQIKITCICT